MKCSKIFIKAFFIAGACSLILFLETCSFRGESVAENKMFSKENSLKALFKDPPHETRPQAWWWWLRNPTNKAAITKDLEEMKAKGLSGCMILDGGVSSFGPRKWEKKTIIGETEIKYEYTNEYKGGSLIRPEEKMEIWSRPWRDMVRFASKEAGRLGLDLGVFIGPAGCAAPWVTPKYAQQEMVWSDTLINGGELLDFKLIKPSIPLVKQTGRVDEIIKQAQASNYNDIAILAFPVKEKVLSEDVIDLTDKIDENNQFKWNPPAGKWKIFRFGYRPTGKNLDGVFYIDHLSKEVFDRHWENTVALLLQEMTKEERPAFKYVECDSWEAGDPNWTKLFPQEFKERRGYDIVKYLPVLVGEIIDGKENSEGFKNDFQLTISDLISENHYERQRDVAHQHDLHSYAEAAGPHQFQADLMKCVGRCDVAMGEFWMPSPHRENPSGRFMVRESATAAHVYGINRVFAESFTSVGPNWEVSPFMMKAAADQAFCDGLNWICFHTFTHRSSLTDVPGITHSAGTHFDRTTTWWNQSAPFVNYLSRCSYMLQQGLFVADVLFYQGHGIGRKINDKNTNAFVWEDGLKNPPSSLGKGYDYDKCNEEVLLSRLSVKDGKLVLPDGMSYRVLVLDEKSSVSLKALKKIVELAGDGAQIIGKPPVSFLGLTDDESEYYNLVNSIWDASSTGERKVGKGLVVWGKSIREVLQQKEVSPDFEVEGVSEKGVFDYIHRKLGETDIYYVSSRWQPVENVECTFRVSAKQPELWNPITGEIRKLTNFKQENGRMIIPLEFDPCGSYFIVFKEAITQQNEELNWTNYQTELQLEGFWNVSFDKEWGGPSNATFEELIDWTSHTNEGIKYYSGKATYHKTFDMSGSELDDKTEYFLDLGKVHELAEVWLNGEDLGVLWTKPFRVNITSILKEKDNQLEIDVVNLWPNRLIGDEFLPENESFTTTNIRKFTKHSELLSSGLLGPVRLMTVIN